MTTLMRESFMHVPVICYSLVQWSRADFDEAGVMACLRKHGEHFWGVGCALCCLELCHHQMQPAQIALRVPPQSLICHWQWTQQPLHCSHQVLEILHDITWRLSKAGESGQQL